MQYDRFVRRIKRVHNFYVKAKNHKNLSSILAFSTSFHRAQKQVESPTVTMPVSLSVRSWCTVLESADSALWWWMLKRRKCSTYMRLPFKTFKFNDCIVRLAFFSIVIHLTSSVCIFQSNVSSISIISAILLSLVCILDISTDEKQYICVMCEIFMYHQRY